MNVLIIGSGGREHAIGLKVKESADCEKLFFAPGNPGMSEIGECVNIGVSDLHALSSFAKENDIGLTIVGPEQPLVDGVVDHFSKEGLLAFGPTQAAAQLEGSKAFSKDIMDKYKVPTAAFESFTDLESAMKFLNEKGAPIVIKASGLAAGKGALVCMTMQEATDALESMLGENAVFGDAGKTVVIEEFMTGEEASLFAVCDGNSYELLNTAQDHKRIFDNDEGLNTGGMGAYSPAPIVTADLLMEVEETIIQPTLDGMKAENAPYKGILYVGIMVTPEGPKVVEYNCRLGDPEAQVVLPLFKGDFLKLCKEAAEGNIQTKTPRNESEFASIVVMSAEGYPGSYAKGDEISGLEELTSNPHVVHAGTKLNDGKYFTNGGRVLGVVARGATLKECLELNYQGVSKVQFRGAHFRKDIGQKGLKRLGE